MPGVATSHSQRGGGRCRASEAGGRRDKPLPAKGVAAVGRRKQVGVATSHSQRRGWPLSGVGIWWASRQATPSEGGGRCRASEAGGRRDKPLPAKGVAAVGRRKQVGVATSHSQRRGWPLSGVGIWWASRQATPSEGGGRCRALEAGGRRDKPLPAKGVAAVGRRKQVGVATSHSQRMGWPLSGVGSRWASRQATPSEGGGRCRASEAGGRRDKPLPAKGVAAVGRRNLVGVATSHSQRRGWPLSGVGSRWASRQATPSEGGGRCRASEAGGRRDKPLPAKGVAAVGRRNLVGVATSHSQRRGWPLSGVGSRWASRQATPSEGGGRCRASEAGGRRDKPLPANGVAAVGRWKQVGVATSHSQRRGWPLSGVGSRPQGGGARVPRSRRSVWRIGHRSRPMHARV